MQLPSSLAQTLRNTALQLIVRGKGILAADESSGTCDKRFDAYGIEKKEERRRAWRELLFTTPEVSKSLSGVILYDETFWQESNGVPFPKLLANKGIMPGIKVDQGLEPMEGSPAEKVTKGLGGLSERLKRYADSGARFAKWRAVIAIGENLPTDACLHENAVRLTKYALECQRVGIVPILEPEVLLDGTHTLARSEEVLAKTLRVLFDEVREQVVFLPGLILKSSMALPGNGSGQNVSDEDIAEATLRAFRDSVPFEVPGIVFLSGGQTSKQATSRLRVIAKKAKAQQVQWNITFSYSRALQEPVLDVWRGDDTKTKDAQHIFQQQVEKTAKASIGL